MNLLYEKYANTVLDNKGYLKEISFNLKEDFNFGFDVVDEIAKKNPTKKAMVWLSEEKEERIFTFKDISDLSNQAANYFLDLGIKKSDKVMLLLRRNYQFWICMVALHKIGAVAIPATDQLTKKDLLYRFNKVSVSSVLVTSHGKISEEVNLSVKEYNGIKNKIMVNGAKEGYLDFDLDIQKHPKTLERTSLAEDTKIDDLMLMFFTSGTTGNPKIAAHTFSYPLGHIVTARYWHQVDPNGIHFTISDTGWGKAVWGKLYGQWLCEAAVFTYDFDRFHADDLLPLFKKYNITTFCAPPTMFRFFIKEDLSKFDLNSLKHVSIAGEALNPEVFNQFYMATGLKLMEGFGQTETTLTVANLNGMEPKPGSMGKPNPQYDILIVDNEDNEANIGQTGEVVVRLDTNKTVGIFKEYFLDEESTLKAKSGSFYHTGDMAWKDEDGYLWFVGRKDDLIKSSGYRISPFEIESVIMEHKSVLEVAVTAVPDEIRGQAVKATIILAKGFEKSEELKKEIQDYVKKHTAPYKYPRVIEFVDELPKTISGKIKRAEIRKG